MGTRYDRFGDSKVSPILTETGHETLVRGREHEVERAGYTRVDERTLISVFVDRMMQIGRHQSSCGGTTKARSFEAWENGGRGGIRTTFGSFAIFHYSATTTSLPEANSLITNERQKNQAFLGVCQAPAITHLIPINYSPITHLHPFTGTSTGTFF